MNRYQDAPALTLLGYRTGHYALYLCTRCERLEVFEAEDGRWLRRTYYDGAPVLHKAVEG